MSSVHSYYYGNIFDERTNQTLNEISDIVRPHIPEYVSEFYQQLLKDKASAHFLDSELVEVRLKKQLVLPR